MPGIAITIGTITIQNVTITDGPCPPLPVVQWQVGPLMLKGVSRMPIEVTMTTDEQCRLAITPVTASGHPADIDGAAQWSVEGSCTLMPIDDLSVWVVSGDSPGDSVVTVSVDADVGEGFRELTDTATYHVGTPMAEQLGLMADTPVLKGQP
jgi:hypothetical protein